MWIFSLALAQEEPTTEPVETEPVEVPATEPAAEEPVVFEIPRVEVDLPSAARTVGDLKKLDSDPEALEAALAEAGFDMADFERPALVQGAWYVRPVLEATSLFRGDVGGSGVRMGLAFGRQFWSIDALPIQVASDIGVRATVPIGRSQGWRVDGRAGIGPWLGPVQARLLTGVRWEREVWRETELLEGSALWLGGLGVAFDPGPIKLSLAALPGFDLTGKRSVTGDALLPRIGTETQYEAALMIPTRPLGIRVNAGWRDTAIGSIFDVGLSFSIIPR